MGLVNDFITYLKKAIPSLVKKVGTFLLFVFLLGVFFGYFIVANKGPIYLLVPLISMAVMYYRLDEGVLVFVLLIAFSIWY